MIDRLKGAWRLVWVGLRWPYRQKSAWINVGAWTFALALVGFAVTADIITGRWWWLLWQGVVGAFDAVCLYRSVAGLLWRRNLDKTLTGSRFMN